MKRLPRSGALSKLAPAVRLGEAADQAEPNTTAGNLGFRGAAPARERLENSVEIRAVDSNPVIFHRDPHLVRVGRIIGLHPDPAAFASILFRVIEEVTNGRLQPLGIAPDSRHGQIQRQFQGEAAARQFFPSRRYGLLDDLQHANSRSTGLRRRAWIPANSRVCSTRSIRRRACS